MTLTRNPCELDTMSLFQDLKLKRRKVDSRCSSDGESVAETSTSSPDMAGPPSPCPKLTGEGRSSPSPEREPSRERYPDPGIRDKSSSVSEIRDSQVKEEGDNSVFDGGGDSRDDQQVLTDSIVKQEKSNDESEEFISKKEESVKEKLAKDIKIKQEILAQQEQRSQEEKQQEERRLENEEIKRLQEERLMEEMREKREMMEKQEEKQRTEQAARERENARMREEELFRQHHESKIQRMQEEFRIKQEIDREKFNSNVLVSEQRRNERGPVIENAERQWHSPVSERWQSSVQTERMKYPPMNAERVIVERQRHSPPSVIERMRLSPEQQLQQQRIRTSPEQRERLSPEQPRVRLSPEQLRLKTGPEQQRMRLSPEQSRVRISPDQQRLSPLIQRSSPIIQRQPSVGEQGSPGGVINMVPPSGFWVNPNAGRINGVKPELIGGGNVNVGYPPIQLTDMKPPRPVNTPVSPGTARQTPTVIMGEAGGVRTMIWSQPNPSSPPDPPAQNTSASTSTMGWSSSSQSSAGGASSNSSEESAAQLLLNLGQTDRQQVQQHPHYQQPLNMERLWAGDLSQLPPSQQNQALNLALMPGSWSREVKPPGMGMMGETRPDPEDDEQPMICMICEDKATGLHYGIITCEGCKGFFKRTVQNRRVYTCVADGNCEITKAQRNRCQYCRFKKCIEQGMVLQAVREDRMPGGRNSGAVYNLYKVKYKKHKKNPKNGQVKGSHIEKGAQQKSPVSPEHGVPSHLVNGTILKTALTNPSEVVHLRQRLDNAVSSSRDRTFPLETILNMIQALIDCDEFQDIATLQNLEDLLDHKSDLSEKLCQIGDSIVYKLVQWTKRLPFYLELPVEVHTRLLTHKWHELLVLTTSAYQAIHGVHKLSSTSTAGQEADFTQEVSNNLVTLQTCLTSMMGRPITMDQLRQDVGLMVEKITHVTLMFRRVKLRMEEYVCLKVITMLNQARGGSAELEAIQDRYMTCLRSYVEHNFPQHPGRFHELLLRLPEIQSAAALLLESKMFYVPFLLNSAIQR